MSKAKQATKKPQVRLYCNGDRCQRALECLRFLNGVKIASESYREIDECFLNEDEETCDRFVKATP